MFTSRNLVGRVTNAVLSNSKWTSLYINNDISTMWVREQFAAFCSSFVNMITGFV